MMLRFVTCALVVAACGGGSKLDRPGQAEPAASDPVDKDAPKRSTLTAEKLVPIIHELGDENVVPGAIVVSFATPIIERDESGRVTSKSLLKITPEIAGSLVYSGVSELRFQPSAPLEAATTYKVDLLKVETRDGVLEPGSAKWTYSFKTPAFKLNSWAATDVDLITKRATMEIAFTGGVLPNVALQSLQLTLDGTPIGNDTFGTLKSGVQVIAQRTQANPHLVVLQITDSRLKVGSKLGLALKPDLMSISGAKAPAAKLAYTVSKDELASIKGAKFVEGANGYFLEVACDDKAAAEGHRSYYEGGESNYNLSERCQLSDESLARVTFNPPVKKTYISGGKTGFRVFGDFKRGVYTVKIDAGARTIDGGTITAPFSRSYSVAARKPQLSFAATGRYLPRKAWSNLGIKHLNVEDVNLVVRQVPPENLIFWLGNTGSDAADERTSNVILKKTLPLRSEADGPTTTWQDVSTLLPSTSKGVLELKLAGVGVHATSRLLLTDLSLVAKKSSVPEKPWLQTVQVWALDMSSSELLDGVEVNLVRKSGKSVATCKTKGDSGCQLEVRADTKDPDQAEPFALIATKGDDLTYLRYQDLRADVTESNTSGVPYIASTPYRAAMYSDRGVYRPGDTAHVVAIVRDAKDRAPDQALPVDVKVVDPRAKVVKKLQLKTNSSGVIAIDHVLPNFADTGHWRVQLSVADKPLAAYDIQVEEFVPERMAATITPKAPEVLTGGKLEFDIAARYLFGGNAIDSGVTLNCSIAPDRFSPEENSDLTYGIEPKGKPVNLEVVKVQLDPRGQITTACPETEDATSFTSTAQVTAVASVLEAGSGRATVRTGHATIHPEKFYIGVKTKSPMATTGKTFTVEGLLVDWTGKPYTQPVASIDIELAHLEADYGYGYDEETGEARYDRNMRTVPEGKQTVPVIGGRFKVDVTPGEADIGYVVKLKSGNARTDLLLDGLYPYEYYSEYFENDRVDQTPRPAKPTKLVVKLPKDGLEVGKAATVKVLAPYKGKILWTIETDKVVTSEWADTAGGEASWTFTLAQFAPNVYVSAFLVKDPHLESKDAFLPDRAFGVASARVTPVHATQVVKIIAPKEVRSSSPLAVTLDLGGPLTEPTFATVAVVDEGILSLTNFQSPDPNAQLFSKRALAVETYETIGWTMLHQPSGASSKTGGGDGPEEESAGGGGDKSRVSPVKPVAMFSGIVQVGADGKVTIPFQLPTYRGKVRIMAITASASKVGRATAEVTVKDPLVVQVTFPRFVIHNDEIQVPVFMTNMSGGKLQISVKLDSQNIEVPGVVVRKDGPAPLTFVGKDTGTLTLENGRADTVVFSVKAAIPIGGAKLRVVAKAGNLEVKDELEVPFLPAGPKERSIQKIKLEAGKLDLAAKATALKGWVPTSETTTFWVTSNPYGESFEHLKYLLHYPYGCIEQTASSTRPLLYVGALAEQLDSKLAALKTEDMVISGINRIFSMQTPAGGFGYWPGATEPEDWGTAYATHLLIDAKKAGYAVPEDRLREVLAWMDTRASAYERGLGAYARHSWQYYDGQVQAYFHYVLALAGKGKKARVLKLISDYPAAAKLSGEQQEDLYLLKAALYLAGDRRYEGELKTVDASPISTYRANYWSFYSDRRRRGLMLSTFFDLFGNDPAGEPLAARVAQGLVGQPSYYYNTQELVWGVTGLGKWVAKQSSAGTAGGTLSADGTEMKPRVTKAKSNDRSWTVWRAGDYKSLVLDVPQSAAGMWLVVNSEGVRPDAKYKVGGNGMSVSRTYRTLDGQTADIGDGTLKLGDLLYVEVEVGNTSAVPIQNIALVDRLPAGLEIENPRLGRSVKLDWVTDTDIWAVDYQNMRDDRIEAFGVLAPNTTKKIVYTVRAVTSGKFTVPPVEAEAMYDPTLWAREAGATAVIGGPWGGKTI